MKVLSIRNLELPVSCEYCQLRYCGKCEMTGSRCSDDISKRADNCPIYEVEIIEPEEMTIREALMCLRFEQRGLIDAKGPDYSGVAALDVAIRELKRILEEDDD